MDIIESIDLPSRDGFDLRLDALPEYDDPAAMFDDSVIDLDQLRYDIDRGNLVWFCARLVVSKKEIELGDDYLGGCCYDSVQDFVDNGGYLDDMIDIAMREAKQKLSELCAMREQLQDLAFVQEQAD